MSFAESILTEDLEPLRQRLLFHPLWTGIERGRLSRETLRVFALQDWWLVRGAYRLDALAVAEMPDLDLQESPARQARTQGRGLPPPEREKIGRLRLHSSSH